MALFSKSDDGESGQTQLNSIRSFLHRWYNLNLSTNSFSNLGEQLLPSFPVPYMGR
jgi:hypothetical protein